MSQGDAIARYIDECDRQLRVYGSRSDNNNGSSSPPRSSPMNEQQQQPAASTAEEPSTTTTTPGETSASFQSTTHHQNSNTNSNSNTPLNTPAAAEDGNDDGGVLLCPRGLAAIPLLCAAASESRSAYLARLQVTHPSNGVRSKDIHIMCHTCVQ